MTLDGWPDGFLAYRPSPTPAVIERPWTDRGSAAGEGVAEPLNSQRQDPGSSKSLRSNKDGLT